MYDTEDDIIDSEDDIQPQWLEGKAAVGITAGASAPEVLVQKVVDYLQSLGATLPQEQLGTPENITFSMPKELRLPVNWARQKPFKYSFCRVHRIF